MARLPHPFRRPRQSSRHDLQRLFVSCESKAMCNLEAGPWPDALATTFLLGGGKVVDIAFGPS